MHDGIFSHMPQRIRNGIIQQTKNCDFHWWYQDLFYRGVKFYFSFSSPFLLPTQGEIQNFMCAFTPYAHITYPLIRTYCLFVCMSNITLLIVNEIDYFKTLLILQVNLLHFLIKKFYENIIRYIFLTQIWFFKD